MTGSGHIDHAGTPMAFPQEQCVCPDCTNNSRRDQRQLRPTGYEIHGHRKRVSCLIAHDCLSCPGCGKHFECNSRLLDHIRSKGCRDKILSSQPVDAKLMPFRFFLNFALLTCAPWDVEQRSSRQVVYGCLRAHCGRARRASGLRSAWWHERLCGRYLAARADPSWRRHPEHERLLERGQPRISPACLNYPENGTEALLN